MISIIQWLNKSRGRNSNLCKFEKITCPSCNGELEYIGVNNKRRSFKCTKCDWEGSSEFKYEQYEVDYRSMEKSCNRCGAKEGDLHEFLCGMEYCPYCGETLMSDYCSCLYKNLGYDIDPPNVPEHFTTEGWTDKDVEESLKFLEKKGRIPNIHYPNTCPKCGVLWPIPFDKSGEDVYNILMKNMSYRSLCYTCFKDVRLLIENGREDEISFPERCFYCGNDSVEPLNVKKEVWESYIQPNMRDKTMCKPCFESIKDKIDKYTQNAN